MTTVWMRWLAALVVGTGTFAQAAVAKSWDFNTPGNTENWQAAANVSGVTVSSAVSGSEIVLTSSEITGADAQIRYNQAGSSGLWIDPGGLNWDKLIVRIRLLDKNPAEPSVASKPWPEPASGTLVLIDYAATQLNTGAIGTGSGRDIEHQADNWIVASFDIGEIGTHIIKAVRVDPISDDINSNFEIDYVQLTKTNSPTPEVIPYQYIVGMEKSGDSLKLVINPDRDLSDLMLAHRTNLLSGSWEFTTYGTNGTGDFLQTDLSAAVPEGTNYAIYAPIVSDRGFYCIDPTPQSDWFTVLAEKDPSVTTHDLVSGNFTVGISDTGGGYINRIVMPGYGDIMGVQADKYGRGGQSSIRGLMHGDRYNPTQAGFSDPGGTLCRVCTVPDGSALVVAPRPCCLYRGDGQFDFTEWENLGSDSYDDGGNSDADTIDESSLVGKQATEVTSEFDYYCIYQDMLGRTASAYGGTDEISIPAVRHYYEYRYIRDPGHGIGQHIAGPLYDPVAGEITDISVVSPSGTHAATSNEMGVITWSMSIRIDRAIWTASHIGTVDGSTIGDLSMTANTALTLRRTYRDTTLASRAPQHPGTGGVDVEVPLFILADSSDIDQGGALGLYYPNSTVNEKCVIGVDRDTGSILYEDDRRTYTKIHNQPERIATMSWNGFRGYILGVLNPTRLPFTQYEAFRGELYLLYGSPREIFENAQRIQPF
ncbi:MAG: hypothetical protein HN919_13740 [Verrucomicrobia bacterium]|nr:hypothetical protein [Verrucomicrobiota bacterium]